jgi:hypothetical protein
MHDLHPKNVKTHGHFMGHEKEPPQPNGPRSEKRQKAPPVHSHSARPQRKLAVRKMSRKRM